MHSDASSCHSMSWDKCHFHTEPHVTCNTHGALLLYFYKKTCGTYTRFFSWKASNLGSMTVRRWAGNDLIWAEVSSRQQRLNSWQYICLLASLETFSNLRHSIVHSRSTSDTYRLFTINNRLLLMWQHQSTLQMRQSDHSILHAMGNSFTFCGVIAIISMWNLPHSYTY